MPYKDPEKKKAYDVAYSATPKHKAYCAAYQANPERKEKKLFQARLRDAGWTREAFAAAWIKQDGKCATCGVQLLPTGRKRNSVTADHCHDTGKPRDLLCRRCNRIEGTVKKHAKTFLEYAAKWAEIHANLMLA